MNGTNVRSSATPLILFIVIVCGVSLQCGQAVTEAEEEAGPEVSQIDLPIEPYVGYWDWIHSCGGFTGRCYTPETEGTGQLLILGESGDFEMIVADTSAVAGSFYITEEESKPAIWFEPDEGSGKRRQWIALEGPDTLVLDDGCCDMFQSRYVRIENRRR